MLRRITTLSMAVCGASAMLACGAAAGPDQRATTSKQARLPRPVALARADAARARHVRVSQVRVVSVTRRTWLNGCFGLPAPELCPPGPTPGYRAVFSVRGRRLAYRTDLRTTFRLEPA